MEVVPTASHPAADKRWSTAHIHHFLTCRLGDDLMLFDRRSGQTHRLNAVAEQALNLMIESPRTCDELAAELARWADVQRDDEVLGMANRLIGDFDSLGLVEAVSP